MPDFEDKVTVSGVRCTRQTEKALLCVLDGGREVWVPQSVVDDDSEVFERGHEGDLVVSAWFAKREGLN